MHFLIKQWKNCLTLLLAMLLKLLDVTIGVKSQCRYSATAFQENDVIRDQLLTYCPLQCPEAESAYVMLKQPSNNNKCLAYFTYNVVRRKNDWFLWRSGKCLFEEIQFDIGCTFPFRKNTVLKSPKKDKEFSRWISEFLKLLKFAGSTIGAAPPSSK